ncbi:helicase POLQ-like isoform X3 [Microplitis mediator]|uniref:helicase POLQ-like isoform X3 n=1 Tax=Microplitis mediator TaxID=375433 RepID=UPI0025530943|nr:helicase POLQ-like isoform X3 [Microplitis mediator]
MNNKKLTIDLNATLEEEIYVPEDFQWNETSWVDHSIISESKIIDSDALNRSIESFEHLANKLDSNDDEMLDIHKNEINKVDIIENDELLTQDFKSTMSTDLNQEPAETEKNSNDLNQQNFYGLPIQVESLIKKTKNITQLYDWQDECLKAVDNRENLIYALPTSGGKTLVAEILMLKEILCHKKNVIFVLPYIAIVQEKIQSMAPFAIELGFLLEEYAGGKGQYPPIKRRRKNTIYICTIEKASGLLNSLIETNRLEEIGLVVVDELHSLGENSGRGATLEGFLTKLIFINENIQIVGMSATIGNLNEIAEFLKANLYTKNFRPVQLREYVMCNDHLCQIDLNHENIITHGKKINYSYPVAASKLDPDKIGCLVMDVIPEHNCLIFCSSRKNCENVSLLLTQVLHRYECFLLIIKTYCNNYFNCVRSLIEYKKNDKKKLLENLKDDSRSLCPILLQTVKYGVAYHHSGLTNDERRLLEEAFKDNIISVICCTSTLAAGVNLPARRVILRSPYIGNEFINLSKYKQMIGRAGRTGMSEIGESILLCKQSEIPKVRELLRSRIEDCVSSLGTEENRGINNLILSSVMLSIATTRNQLHNLVYSSLLKVQASQLNVDIKKFTDKAIKNLIKIQALQVDNKLCMKANMTVTIQSQSSELMAVDENISDVNECQRSIVLTGSSCLKLSNIGRAAMKGCIDLKTAYILYEDLKIAQKHLILCNDLHILYLVTPYQLADQLTPIGLIYYETIINLPPLSMNIARLLGINEIVIMKLRDGMVPKELPEFWAFTELFKTFYKKLVYNCSVELESFMELPAVKAARAKQIYNAGYKTLQSIASADPKEFQKNINHLSRKDAERITVAAKIVQLGEKVMEMKQTTQRRQKDSNQSNGIQRTSKKNHPTADARSKTAETNDKKMTIDADSLTIWHHPITTFSYFIQELILNCINLTKEILRYKKTVWGVVFLVAFFITLRSSSGPHQQVLKVWENILLWWLYWVGLGVLSSVGLGTGLHTFVLYLGPHIAAVTMAAYECGGLNFPEPPYPDSIMCPTVVDQAWAASIFNIMRKVRVEAMLWGAGTALGELPPYFMARAARNSGKFDKNDEHDQEDLKELKALEALESGENVPLIMRLKLAMKHFVQKAGFFGILACASIPNPLFDLAGLTCGHYRIPFWTFFGATLIGKAIIKMHVQQLAVIIAFNEELLDKAIGVLAVVPYFGNKFQEPLKKYLVEQKNKLHNSSSVDSTTTISWLFDKFVILMVCYFLITIIHALARNHHRRRTKSCVD